MRITEPSATSWTQLRPEDPDASARARPPAPQPAVVVWLNVLDTDRDGWLDEDDLPYDQIMMLQRARAAPQIDLLA